MDISELPRPVGFVLTGGASNGATQAGMLRALQEAGAVPDLVAGTSVGALNGAVVAEDPDLGAARLLGIWSELETSDVFTDGVITRLRNLVGTRRYLYSGRGLRRFAAGHLRATSFDQLRLPFVAVATDVLGGHAVTLSSGSLIDAVAASAAIPGVLPNVEIGGRLLMDGGVVANAPVDAAMEMGAASLVVLDAGYACHLTDPPSHAAARILHATSVMIRRQVEIQVLEAAERVPVVALPPLCPLRTSPLDFSHAADLIGKAYESSRAFLADLEVTGVGLHGKLHRHAVA
ncbi:MAG: patatin-like phospholipase family protein [Actinomycetota bacterium]